MRWVYTLVGFILFVALLLVARSIRPAKGSKSHANINYAPEGFQKTIRAGIRGVVTSTRQDGLFYVTVNGQDYPFTYDEYQMPEHWQKTYPRDFILQGDSIRKDFNTDTFYVIRNGTGHLYILPR